MAKGNFSLALFTVLATEKTITLGFYSSVTVLMGAIFILRASAIQWGWYYPRWLTYGVPDK